MDNEMIINEIEEETTPVEEIAEEVVTSEEPAVETAAEEAPKTFTQADVDRMIKEKLDEILPGKISRARAKVEKEYAQKYGTLEGIMKAVTGKGTVEEMNAMLTEHYGKKGVSLPQNNTTNERDALVLARADAEEYIANDEVDEEITRLLKIGADKMTARDKAVYQILATHKSESERRNALTAIGVGAEVYDSKEFKDFAKKFSSTTPADEIYEIFKATTTPKKNIKPMGSIRGNAPDKVKDYYTPEEIARLTDEQLDDPQVWTAVRRSMTGR